MSESPRAWEVVLRHLESQLLSGELAPGDHVPPERTLAAQLGVGRSSVREALRVLDILGLIRAQTGSGPHAGAVIISAPSGGMSSLMRLQVAAKGFAVTDVVKTRLLLESAVVTDLAGNPADLGAATALLDAMDSPELTAQEFLALDAGFHVALAEASGNQVVATMMIGLRASIEGYVLHGVSGVADWPAAARKLRAEHRSIIDAISTGDSSTAASRVHAHITDYYRFTKLTEQDSQ